MEEKQRMDINKNECIKMFIIIIAKLFPVKLAENTAMENIKYKERRIYPIHFKQSYKLK